MNEKLRRYVENLFEEAPQNKKTIELKEEMIQNLQEKYQDLLEEGKSEEAAYNIAIASIGDVSGLLEELQASGTEKHYSQEMLLKSRNRSALLVTIAVMLYILCVLPVIFANYFENEVQGLVLMVLMVAAATGLLVYNNMTKLKKVRMDDTVVEEFREWKEKGNSLNQIFRSVSIALWSLAIAVYFMVSFVTMAWYITWVIFLIAGAVQAIVKAVFDLVKAGR